MAFDPFPNRSRDFFGQTRFSDSVGEQSSAIARMAGETAANKNYVLAAKRARQYREDRENEMIRQQQAQQRRSSRGGLFGAIAGGLTSLIPGVGPVLAPVVGSAVGSITSRA